MILVTLRTKTGNDGIVKFWRKLPFWDTVKTVQVEAPYVLANQVLIFFKEALSECQD